jgi:hypothetical protein
MTRAQVTTFGIFAGLAGIEHGIGEILQGNKAPGGILFPSWPESELLRTLAGEPAMSLIPNFLVSGILGVSLSLLLIAWAALFVHRKHGGLILMLLSVVLLLVGGGFGPPLLGLAAGAAGTRIHAPLFWWRAHLPARVLRFLSAASPWIFAACLIAWLSLMPGSILLGHWMGAGGPANADHVMFFMLAAFTLLPLAFIAGFARDILKADPSR